MPQRERLHLGLGLSSFAIAVGVLIIIIIVDGSEWYRWFLVLLATVQGIAQMLQFRGSRRARHAGSTTEG